jgi:hypothetical protein
MIAPFTPGNKNCSGVRRLQLSINPPGAGFALSDSGGINIGMPFARFFRSLDRSRGGGSFTLGCDLECFLTACAAGIKAYDLKYVTPRFSERISQFGSINWHDFTVHGPLTGIIWPDNCRVSMICILADMTVAFNRCWLWRFIYDNFDGIAVVGPSARTDEGDSDGMKPRFSPVKEERGRGFA